ncbi:MAG: hypothetical protein SPL13_00065 [Clostridia bacterium]|nr:hypothetical protein [Clostridia bacterium]
MFDYVYDKQELKELKNACETIIKNVQQSWLKDYFTFQFILIGSGSNNLITKNGENGEFDLDYNFILQKDKQGLINDPKKIKELFIKAFNEMNPNLGFKPAENSTSVITSKLIYGNRLHFSFDVAIMCEGNNGNYLKIVHNKVTGQYYWNEVRHSRNYQTKIKAIKDAGEWNDLRERYLKLKNQHLSKQEDIASFLILIQAINEICD